jgi:hypothetical protein
MQRGNCRAVWCAVGPMWMGMLGVIRLVLARPPKCDALPRYDGRDLILASKTN